MKIIPNNITLEKVKKSNYWELIAILIWGHYNEPKFQDENAIIISEKWYGKHKEGNGSYHTSDWNNPDFKVDDYIRTLYAIMITFTRKDYISHIYINVETGNVYAISSLKGVSFSTPNVDITNWMLENNLLKVDV